MFAILQRTFSKAFSWMKMLKLWLRFHWCLFRRVQLTIFQHWFRSWFGADQATSHYLNQWWLVYWRIYASLGLNELKVLLTNSQPWAHATARRRTGDKLLPVLIITQFTDTYGRHKATLNRHMDELASCMIVHFLAHISKWELVCKLGVIFHIFIISCLGSRSMHDTSDILLYNSLFTYQVLCTRIYRRRSLYSFLLADELHSPV